MISQLMYFSNNKSNKEKKDERLRKKKYSRVDIQVSFLTAAIVIVACYLIFFVNYYFSYTSMIDDLQDRALRLHSYLERLLDNETFHILDEREDEDTETYLYAREIMERAKEVTGVRYFYTAKMIKDGTFIYLVDGLDSSSPDFRHIGDPIEPECIPDMERALTGSVVLPERISRTSWGPVFIVYFPMHEENEVIGVVGMEFDAGNQYSNFRRMAIVTPVIIVFFCLVSSFIAIRWFRRISNPSFQDLATIDFLTGLKNRNSFEVNLDNLDVKKNREGICIISIDLDDLKTVNDTYGHPAGDEYIILGAKIIGEMISFPDILYRIGGDEFCIILMKKNQKEVEDLMNAVWKRAEEETKSCQYPVGISMGYAIFDNQMDKSLYDTLKRADVQMYLYKRKKKAGRQG